MLKNLWDLYLKKIQKRYRQFFIRFHNRSVIKKWRKAGSTYPAPHEFRQETIKKYAFKNKLDVFVETGTYQGKMVYALQDFFPQIFSIELNIDHYLNAKEKFYPLSHVEIIKGESGEQLATLLENIGKPMIIWLDTHAWLEKGRMKISILDELKAILSSKYDHVTLINDARMMRGENGYPDLIGLRNYIAGLRPEYQFEVEDDIIRLVIPGQMPTSALNE